MNDLGGISSLATILAQGGAVAILAYLAVWLSRWAPQLHAARVAEQGAERDARQKIAETYQGTTARMSETFQETARQERAQAAELARYERESCERRHTELLAGLKEMSERHREEFRVVHHGLANVANAVGLRSRAQAEQASRQDAEASERTILTSGP